MSHQKMTPVCILRPLQVKNTDVFTTQMYVYVAMVILWY